MSDAVKIVLSNREESGSAACGRLRRAGWVPAVVYGPAIASNLSVKVETKVIEPILMAASKLEDIAFEGTMPDGSVKKLSVKAASRDRFRDILLHVDFYCAG